ncbi:MAG: hypothetical protein C4K60_12120 [Ideonella sp. MAG2]|nr:MAG: hypothetical protein C4K60_12120 [Ideonella sp. MAG2]
MTCVLDNRTACPAVWHLMPDADGGEAGLLVVKASFCLSTGRLAAAESQCQVKMLPKHVPIADLPLSDAQFRLLGDRAKQTILWEDHDLSPPKPNFNLLVQATVTVPPGGAGDYVTAGLKVGNKTVGVKVFGPRYRLQGLLGKELKRLDGAAAEVPLNYAFSGGEGSLLETPDNKEQELSLLPWFEPIVQPGAEVLLHEYFGLSHCPVGAAHRRKFAGTYDEQWKSERAPLLPEDFDRRFWNDASPTLQWPDPLVAGTSIRMANLSRVPLVVGTVPSMTWRVKGYDDVGKLQCDVRLRNDTLLLEPDADRMTFTWRALFSKGPAGGLPKRLLIEALA